MKRLGGIMRSRLLQLTAGAALIGVLSLAAVPAFAQQNTGFEAGVEAYENGRYDDAISVWEPLAEGGNVDALNMLAQLYRLGLGVQQDDKKAFDLYEQAANRGSDEAQVNVAFQLLTGKGVEQDREQAASWFAKASDRGNPLAQYNLGLMYEKGIGVEQDREFAAELYSIAADKGQKRAIARLEALETNAAEEAEIENARNSKSEAQEKRLAEEKAADAEKRAKKDRAREALSIKRVEPSALEFEKNGAETEDYRPMIDVVRTPTRKPGEKVAGAPKGNEPKPIFIKRLPATDKQDDAKADDEKAGASNKDTGKTAEKTRDSMSASARMPSDPAARIMLAERAYRSGDFSGAADMLAPLSNAGLPVAQFWMGRLYNRGEGVKLNRPEAYSLWRSAAAGGSEQAATALANLAARLPPEEISIFEQRHKASGRAR